jgi:hypothetical protein
MNSPEIPTYFVHSANDQGDWDPLRMHLDDVAKRAAPRAGCVD